MSYSHLDVTSLRDHLSGSAKHAAKILAKNSPGLVHSGALDRIAQLVGMRRWSVFVGHLMADDAESVLGFAERLQPEFRRLGLPEFIDAADLMRQWVLGRYTPLQDFAFYDSESANGYAWPEEELIPALYEYFHKVFPDATIEMVGAELEAKSGPWGIEDYGRTDADEDE